MIEIGLDLVIGHTKAKKGSDTKEQTLSFGDDED